MINGAQMAELTSPPLQSHPILCPIFQIGQGVQCQWQQDADQCQAGGGQRVHLQLFITVWIRGSGVQMSPGAVPALLQLRLLRVYRGDVVIWLQPLWVQ